MLRTVVALASGVLLIGCGQSYERVNYNAPKSKGSSVKIDLGAVPLSGSSLAGPQLPTVKPKQTIDFVATLRPEDQKTAKGLLVLQIEQSSTKGPVIEGTSVFGLETGGDPSWTLPAPSKPGQYELILKFAKLSEGGMTESIVQRRTLLCSAN